MRPAFDALFDIDDALADVVVRSTEPTLGAIKLAWWRERLHELDEGKVPAEPRLVAAAAELVARGIRGSELAELEAGWASLLDEETDQEAIAASGAKLFELAARLLGACDPSIAPAGRLYASGKAARRGLIQRQPLAQSHSRPVPRRLRPLTALAALAARDAQRGPPFDPEATPGRALVLLRHRLTGRLPRP